jgi:hypothetical protein
VATYLDQENLIDEKTGDEKSFDTIPLKFADSSQAVSHRAAQIPLIHQEHGGLAKALHPVAFYGLRLDRSTALYIYIAKNCKLLVLFTQAQKTKFIFI